MAVRATDTTADRFSNNRQADIRVLDLPRNNPCAQCGEPIALPSWVEKDGRRTAFLWRCRLCDYRYETIAFYAEAVDQDDALAA